MSRSLICVLLLTLASCAEDRYWVEITPEEGGFTRRLAVARRDGDLRSLYPQAGAIQTSDEGTALEDLLVQHLLQTYGGSLPEGGRVSGIGVQGYFEVATPDDLGGAGFLKRIDSPMGQSWVYIERVRGDDDLIWQRRRRKEAYDLLFELQVDFFNTVFESEPKWATVRELLVGPIREDLLSFIELIVIEGGYVQQPGREIDDELAAATMSRLYLFLHERGYIAATAVAWLLTMDSLEVNAATADRLSGGRLSVLSELLSSLESEEVQALFNEEGALEQSFEAFRDNSRHLASMRVWYAKDRAASEPAELGAEELFERLLNAALGVRLLQDFDVVNVRVRCGVEPVISNGKWLEDEASLIWEIQVDKEREGPVSYPQILFANWVLPNEASQTALLGGVGLGGKKLSEFTSWWHGIGPEQQARWQQAQATGELSMELLRAWKDNDIVVWKKGVQLLIDAAGE
ncbi:MAG: hypothetical protein ACI835_004012 [Planctomycetota bacterium]|jgi:hypothetical protein